MRFVAAGYLVLLIPWLVLVWRLWRRRWLTVAVASRMFWPHARSASTQTSSRSRPPLWVLVALVSILGTILALSRPVLPHRRPSLTVLVDRHVSMSARMADGTIANALVARLQRDLEGSQFDAHLVVRPVPGQSTTLTLQEALARPYTAGETARLIETTYSELARRGEDVAVLSAQALNLPASAIRYAPESVPSNRQIDLLSASVEPISQVMVRVSHPPGASAFEVVVRREQEKARVMLTPPSDAGHSTAFLDMPGPVSGAIEAQIDPGDDFLADDRRYLARNGSWPKLEIGGDVPAGVQRFAAVYQEWRSATGANVVVLTTNVNETRPAILFARTQPLPVLEEIRADLPWRDLSGLSNIQIEAATTMPPPEGFEVIGKQGEAPILAIRRESPRQVWIGFGVDPFSQTAAWVSWMNALVDYVNNERSPTWAAQVPDDISSEWVPIQLFSPSLELSPGIYSTSQGETVAVNLPAVSWQTSPAAQASESLKRALAKARWRQGPEATDWIIATAAVLGFAAGGLLVRSSRLDEKGGAS